MLRRVGELLKTTVAEAGRCKLPGLLKTVSDLLRPTIAEINALCLVSIVWSLSSADPRGLPADVNTRTYSHYRGGPARQNSRLVRGEKSLNTSTIDSLRRDGVSIAH
ncbi:hypothetical protein PUN28_015495 [Cardiocondyla obscurior]|uniref:Uncharacterized protein n=1 Tax=Cardiocondyla obscurior TaxID=286306 RepID=A0AAW2ETB0_9HYME